MFSIALHNYIEAQHSQSLFDWVEKKKQKKNEKGIEKAMGGAIFYAQMLFGENQYTNIGWDVYKV